MTQSLSKGTVVDELNRDLLVAVLALLTDAISRPRLATALKAWSQNQDQPLARILKESAGLDDARIHALESLAAAHLQTHQDDLRQSLGELGAGNLTQDVLTEIDDEELRKTLSTTIGCETTVTMDHVSHGGSDGSFSVHSSPGVKGERFQLIRPHAKGGIGQVWLARDSELQRDVAVKEIQPQFAGSETQRARFVLEAEITGNLEHPGIVPVYSLGRNADGLPFYAMRFIRGESLSVAIRRFHTKITKENTDAKEAKASGTTKWGIDFRQLVGRFLDVCDAIDYAHNQRILHRDLKPANIMLGPYGETLVVDWGLAKVIGQSGDLPADDGEFKPDSAGASDTTSPGTEQGTTIGTPAYMSPEQARGLIDQLSPASDVYSLGASLYELLTGQVAFPERMPVVIQKVLAGDFPPPRAVDRSIPVALEAICLKAMAKDPQARYTSVRALAQDLEHWLADEPTAAHPEGTLERVLRWFRQHRAWTYAAAVALLGFAIVALIAAFVIDGYRRNETVARREAEANFDLAQKARRREEIARVEAETNFGMAQQAVEDYLTNVSENTLLKEQDSADFRRLRHDLLQSALTYYEKFAAERKNDPRLREQLANAHFRVGQITGEIGTKAQAMAAFQSALAIWEPLVDSNPHNHELAGNLAACYLAMGRLESVSADFPAALKELARATAILERVTNENPDQPNYQASLADCYCEIGIAQAKLEKPVESLAIHEQARAIQQALIDRYPENLAYRRGLAENLNAIGYALYRRSDDDAALKTFHEVEDICQALLKEVPYGPKPTWLLNLLALSQYNIGSIHKKRGDIEKALPFFEESLRYRVDLAESQPSVTRFREKVAVSYRELAELEHKARQDPKAFESIDHAIAIWAALVTAQPDSAIFHGDLGLSWNIKGIFYDDARNNADAKVAFEKAVAEQRTALAKSSSTDIYKYYLWNHLENLGEQYLDLGHPADGLPFYREAQKLREELSQAHPENRQYTIQLAEGLIKLGTIERRMGEADAALQSFKSAQKALEKPFEKAPEDRTRQFKFAVALHDQAAVLADLAQFDKARTMLKDAADRFRKLIGRAASDDELANERSRRSETLWDLARVLRKLGTPGEADRVLDERRDLWKTRPPRELLDLALEHLGKATMFGYGKPVPSGRSPAVRELDLDQAAADLKLAIDLGLRDPGKLKSRPESTFLLSRDDVKTLLKQLDSPGPASGAPKAK